MNVKRTTSTPLPMCVRDGTQQEGYHKVIVPAIPGERIAFGVKAADAAYIAHAANAYPKLVEALASFLRAPVVSSSSPGSVTLEVQSFNRNAAAALMRELGEEE